MQGWGPWVLAEEERRADRQDGFRSALRQGDQKGLQEAAVMGSDSPCQR